MFEVTKNSSHVIVRVSLKKRVTAKEPKVYLYAEDAHAEAKRKFPHVKFSSEADSAAMASNVKGPHEAEWKFAIKKTEQPKREEKQEEQEEKKYLKGSSRRAKLEKLNKQIQAEFSKED